MAAPAYDNTPDPVNLDAVDVLGAGKTVILVHDTALGAYRAARVSDFTGAGASASPLALKREEALPMTGAAIALPAAPAGASKVTVQAQNGDIRARLDGATTAPTSTSGLIYYEGEQADLLAAVFTTVRVIGAAGTALELVWWG